MAALNESLHASMNGQWCLGLISQAHSFEELGHFKSALRYFTGALEPIENLFGKESNELANVFNNMGRIYRKQRDVPKALEYYNRELAIGLGRLEAEHPNDFKSRRNQDPDLGFTYNHLAGCYDELGDKGKALEHYDMCVGIWLQKFGPDHAGVLATQKHLVVERPLHEALVLAVSGQYNESLNVFAQALIKAKEEFGKYIHAYMHNHILLYKCNTNDINTYTHTYRRGKLCCR